MLSVSTVFDVIAELQGVHMAAAAYQMRHSAPPLEGTAVAVEGVHIDQE